MDALHILDVGNKVSGVLRESGCLVPALGDRRARPILCRTALNSGCCARQSSAANPGSGGLRALRSPAGSLQSIQVILYLPVCVAQAMWMLSAIAHHARECKPARRDNTLWWIGNTGNVTCCNRLGAAGFFRINRRRLCRDFYFFLVLTHRFVVLPRSATVVLPQSQLCHSRGM